jgi:dienelactone hydrolase
LPDPFVGWQGGTVDSAGDWRARRRELTQLFRHYVYGYPAGSVAVDPVRTATTTLERADISLREVRLDFPDLPEDAPAIHLSVFHPPAASGPLPVVLGINGYGNHTVVDDPAVGRHDVPGVQDGERGEYSHRWDVERAVDRGFALATFRGGDVDPDTDDFRNGVHPYLDDRLDVPCGTEWGTIATWAWGVQRCVDYLEAESLFDGDAIAVTGKSRRGKTALLAGATDERIAATVPIMSGTGGCALSRENAQETVADINDRFPHWFNAMFSAFNGRTERLPVDQHLLVALVAPRPLLQLQGSRDYWANPGLSLEALREAAPVWNLLGASGMPDDGPTYRAGALDEGRAGDIAHFRAEVGHTVVPDHWTAMLNFLQRQFE